ncbi:hypothetical protein KUCAC02_006904 [Chaenocephalus aceratus]|uniref:Uncharacterized protein n=1 Tax=Chaenocephalus aceratus TaxID=36190 RepID=A0ACB9VTT5_CHAAC|nr:hypothetical protein KUCAC02_006904 [Chaenocephalus aceratus]
MRVKVKNTVWCPSCQMETLSRSLVLSTDERVVKENLAPQSDDQQPTNGPWAGSQPLCPLAALRQSAGLILPFLLTLLLSPCVPFVPRRPLLDSL